MTDPTASEAPDRIYGRRHPEWPGAEWDLRPAPFPSTHTWIRATPEREAAGEMERLGRLMLRAEPGSSVWEQAEHDLLALFARLDAERGGGDVMRGFKVEHRYTIRFGRHHHHLWVVVGRLGAVHLSIMDMGEAVEDRGGPRYSGGVEVHHRYPPPAEGAPDHHNCEWTGGVCWHDGSSLLAQERYIPRWLRAPHDHEGNWLALQREYEREFNDGAAGAEGT